MYLLTAWRITRPNPKALRVAAKPAASTMSWAPLVPVPFSAPAVRMPAVDDEGAKTPARSLSQNYPHVRSSVAHIKVAGQRMTALDKAAIIAGAAVAGGILAIKFLGLIS